MWGTRVTRSVLSLSLVAGAWVTAGSASPSTSAGVDVVLPAQLAMEESGVIEDGSTGQSASGGASGVVDYKIYLPAGYEDSDQAYPSLYLLHGRGDSMEAWTREKVALDEMMADGRIPEMIVVMPDAPWADRGNWYVDSKYRGDDLSSAAVETLLTKKLVRHIDRSYRTIDDRKSRAVGGYSMGGYGALRYVLAQQRKFSAAIVLSPAVYTPVPPGESSARAYGAFGVGQQKFDESRYRKLNYPRALRRFDTDYPVHIFFAVGDKDTYVDPGSENLRNALEFETALAYNRVVPVDGVTADWRVLGGGHEWGVWSPAFEEGIQNISSYLTTATNDREPMDAVLLGGEDDDWAGGVVANPDNSTTSALSTQGSIAGQEALGGLDVVVQRRSPESVEWTTTFGNSTNQRAYGMAEGADGRVLVGGYTDGDLDGAHPGNTGNDAFIASVADDGAIDWITQFGSADSADRIYAVASAPDGGAYAAGYTKGSIDGVTTNIGDKDVFVVRVDAAGEVLWRQQLGSSGEDKGLAVTATPTGMAVVGVTGGDLAPDTSAGGYDGFIAAFTEAGQPQWTRQSGTAAYDLFSGAVVNEEGLLVAVGQTEGVLGESSSGGTDATAVAFAADGTQEWVSQWGTAEEDLASTAVVGADGGVTIVGASSGPGEQQVGGFDIFTAPMAPDGSIGDWGQFGTTANDGVDPYQELNLFADAAADGLVVSGVTYGDTLNEQNAGGADVFLSGPESR